MQGRFKFRAWDGYKMFYSFAEEGSTLMEQRPSLYAHHDGELQCGMELQSMGWAKCEIMQGTGLHDSEGTLIYEGDVVHMAHPHRNREHTGVVEWGVAGWTVSGFYWGHFDNPYDPWSEPRHTTITVIGNIYQDSHLLDNTEGGV